MSIKHSSMKIFLLFCCILSSVISYPEYKDDASNVQRDNVQNTSNEEINNSEALQQQVVRSEKNNVPFDQMKMGVNLRTGETLVNGFNISDNQLSNEYSMEHEDAHDDDMVEFEDDNTSLHSTEHNSKFPEENDYETSILLSENNRKHRLFASTTTSVPQYISEIGEETLATKDINISTSDYVENDDEVLKSIPKKQGPTNTALNRQQDNSSEETDGIVPLAFKFYDEIPPENSSAGRHVHEVSSEDYYEDEYHDPELTKTTTSTTTLQTLDNSLLHTLFTGLTSTTDAISTSAMTIPTPTTTPLAITLVNNIPIIGQFNTSLFTTSAPLSRSTPQPQTQIQTVVDAITAPFGSVAGAAAASAVNNDKKGKQIPIISTVPVVTTTDTTTITTTTSRRRLLPYEQLRNYIEDAYIRMPLAVIVDPSTESLGKTKTLWNDAMRTNLNIKIILVTLNEYEESPASFNFNNTRQFLTGLNSIKEQNSGDAFRGISHAAELVPYDSAVFISTANLAKHTDQVQDSAITLLKKRIRLYLIWFGERSLSENETQDSVGGILGEVAIRSGGEILHIVGSENSQQLEGSTLTIVADALRGSQEVDVPVDTTLSSLHVKIDKLMRRAVLETPNGG